MASVLAAVAVALGAAVQTATGFGFSLVSGPFLVAAYQAPTGVQINVLLSLLVNVALLAREHRGSDLRAAGLLLAPAVAVAVPLGYLLRNADPGPATVAAGVICLVAVVALALGRELPGVTSRAGTVAIGAVSGGMNAAAGLSGPAVVIFALHARWPAGMARPTMQVVFLGINVVTLVSLGWPDQLPVAVLAGYGVGIAAGAALVGRLPEAVAHPATLLLAGVGSVLAIARGFAS
ncbi:MAG: TSUP family transporter [Acidimicrobiia bacterium]